MIRLFIILVVLSGCETSKEVIAAKKIKEYDAHYIPAQHGWCSGKPIPDADQWILDCKYGMMSCDE